jgi:AraC family transcriptional regulator
MTLAKHVNRGKLSSSEQAWEALCMGEGASSSGESSRRPYGPGLAANYGVEGAAHMVTRVLRQTEVAVTELHAEAPPERISDPIAPQDAFLICFQLRDRGPFEYWENGRSLGNCALRAGDATIRDLRRDPRAMTSGPLHSVLWFLPRASLNALADEAHAPHVDELHPDPRVGVADSAIQHLSASMLPALRKPEQVNRLFSDHISIALAAHVAQAYGGLRTQSLLISGGLAPWQERRAKEMLVADLAGATPLADVARACGLSSDYFAKAFRRSTGLAPHAWLQKARVDRAKTLLRQPGSSLSAVALACGFADHSHFSRVFNRQTGQTPRDWRRLVVR